MAEKRRALGRGIGALIPENQSENRNSPIDVFFSKDTARLNKSSRAAENITVGEGSAKEAGFAKASVSVKEESTGADSSAAHVGKSDKRTAKEKSGAENVHGRKKKESDAERSGKDSYSAHSAANVSRETKRKDSETELVPVPGATFGNIPLDEIVPNTKQPRQIFDEQDLEELADSIREVGVLQPVVVRPLSAPLPEQKTARYELIMGERRWRASKLAGRKTVPAIVRRTEDEDLLRDALLENLHRAQLNALEEAAAYRQLLDDFQCTQEELSKRIARSRPQISNMLRLLKLPPLVQRRVAAGVLSAGHARALLGLSDPAEMEKVAQRIVAETLSVRATEELVALGDESRKKSVKPRVKTADPEMEILAQQIGDRFDTKVKISMGVKKGKITIEFASPSDLKRIINLMEL